MARIFIEKFSVGRELSKDDIGFLTKVFEPNSVNKRKVKIRDKVYEVKQILNHDDAAIISQLINTHLINIEENCDGSCIVCYEHLGVTICQ